MISIPQMLVVETRLPRIVVALLCGAVLAVSVLLADGKQPSREEDRRVADEIIRILNENLR